MNPESEKSNPLKITGDSRPDVPVFTCIVYVRRNEDGSVFGKVANLDGIESSGASERDVLGRVSREFKARILKSFEEGKQVDLIDPPASPADNEQVRSIPVHL